MFKHDLDTFINPFGAVKYPPCNAVRTEEGNIVVEIAAAGFKPEDIEVTFDGSVLEIIGKSSIESTQGFYLIRGIGQRDFKRSYRITGAFELESAEMDQGLLKVTLRAESPKKKITVVAKDKQELLLEKNN